MIKAGEQEIGSWSRMLQGSHRQVMMKDVKEQIGGDDTPAATRKGPWTAEEDAQLVRFVRLFGERRWDFLAKVSGLKRTGKSCRLRWVNYLHPGLHRGRITADEERLILELHAKWGSRWSRISRSLPGRTDNEIKNFWRTRARKKALEQRKLHSNGGKTAAAATSFSSSSVTSGTSSGSPPNSGSSTPVATKTALQERSGGGDEAELEETSMSHHHQQQQYQSHQQEQQEHCYTMDQLWNEMEAGSWGGAGHHGGAAAMEMPSPVWEFCSDYCSLWSIDDEEYYKMMLDAS